LVFMVFNAFFIVFMMFLPLFYHFLTLPLPQWKSE
jgi:hypothetical protein